MIPDIIPNTRISERMKIYVASGWPFRGMIQTVWYPMLETLGHQITHNWTVCETAVRTPADQATNANNDLRGVRDADVVIVVMTSDKYPYVGTHFEMGAALALQKPVLLYNPTHKEDFEYCAGVAKNVFYYTKGIKHFDSETALVAELTEMSGGVVPKKRAFEETAESTELDSVKNM